MICHKTDLDRLRPGKTWTTRDFKSESIFCAFDVSEDSHSIGRMYFVKVDLCVQLVVLFSIVSCKTKERSN